MLTNDDKIEILRLVREIAIKAEIAQSKNGFGILDIYDVLDAIDDVKIDLINKQLRRADANG